MKKHFTNPKPEEYISFRPIDGTDARDILAELKERIGVRHAEADEDELLMCLWRDDTPAINGAGRIIIDAVADIADTEMMWFVSDINLKSGRYVADIAEEFDYGRMDDEGIEEQFEETHAEMVALLDNLDDYMSLVKYENLCVKLNLLNAMSAKAV